MTNGYEEAFDEASARAEVGFEFGRIDDGNDDQLAVAVGLQDREGRALLVEIGNGPDGVFANVSTFSDDAPAEPRVFAVGNSTMIVVDQLPDPEGG